MLYTLRGAPGGLGFPFPVLPLVMEKDPFDFHELYELNNICFMIEKLKLNSSYLGLAIEYKVFICKIVFLC